MVGECRYFRLGKELCFCSQCDKHHPPSPPSITQHFNKPCFLMKDLWKKPRWITEHGYNSTCSIYKRFQRNITFENWNLASTCRSNSIGWLEKWKSTSHPPFACENREGNFFFAVTEKNFDQFCFIILQVTSVDAARLAPRVVPWQDCGDWLYNQVISAWYFCIETEKRTRSDSDPADSFHWGSSEFGFASRWLDRSIRSGSSLQSPLEPWLLEGEDIVGHVGW